MKNPVTKESLKGFTGSLRGSMGSHFFSRRTIGKDAGAGLTLGIESIPDAMASALLATVNPIFGLYAVMISTPVGAIFASSVFISVQTTSAMSLVVADVPGIQGDDAAGALFTLTVLTGILMLVLGLLKMGTILRFVSNAVMIGFIQGVALLMILGQLGTLTGYDPEGANKLSQTFDLLLHIDEISVRTLVVGLAAIGLIVLLTRTFLKSYGIIVALVAVSAMVPLLGWDSVELVSDIADIPDGLPRPVLPELSGLLDLIIPAIALAFVGLVQGAGVSQNYVNPDGEYPDASGDFRGQGAANIAAGLFQGMPVGGSLSATALVKRSGARTRSANIIAGIVIVIVIAFFSETVGRLVMPALAGLLIVIGVQTLKPDEVRQVWQTGNVQKLVMASTFAATLVMPLQYAVMIGVILSTLLFVIRQSSKIAVKEWVLDEESHLPLEKEPSKLLRSAKVTILRPYGSLFYAAASAFEEQLPRTTDDTRFAVVILNLRGRAELGSTFIDVIERYSRDLREHESRLILAEMKNGVYKQLVKTGLIDTFGQENVYRRTRRVAETIIDAYKDSEDWIEKQQGDKAGRSEPGSTL